MRATFLLLACLFLLTSPAAVAQTDHTRATGGDMYVSCYLYAHNTDVPKRSDGSAEIFSGEMCGLTTIALIVNREGQRPGMQYTFCLPRTAEFQTDPARAMAFAYLDYYDSRGANMRDATGRQLLLLAMVDRWPCS